MLEIYEIFTLHQLTLKFSWSSGLSDSPLQPGNPALHHHIPHDDRGVPGPGHQPQAALPQLRLVTAFLCPVKVTRVGIPHPDTAITVPTTRQSSTTIDSHHGHAPPTFCWPPQSLRSSSWPSHSSCCPRYWPPPPWQLPPTHCPCNCTQPHPSLTQSHWTPHTTIQSPSKRENTLKSWC